MSCGHNWEVLAHVSLFELGFFFRFYIYIALESTNSERCIVILHICH